MTAKPSNSYSLKSGLKVGNNEYIKLTDLSDKLI